MDLLEIMRKRRSIKLYAGADSGREPDEDPSGRPSVRIREGKAPLGVHCCP